MKLHRREILAGVKRVARFDHIQIAAPEGCEPAARKFYGSILGLQEVEKPLALRMRGGCWFQCDEQQVHIGVEPDFHPAQKAHPAFVVFSLDELRQTLLASGIMVVDGEDLPESVVSTLTTPGVTGLNLSKCRATIQGPFYDIFNLYGLQFGCSVL